MGPIGGVPAGRSGAVEVQLVAKLMGIFRLRNAARQGAWLVEGSRGFRDEGWRILLPISFVDWTNRRMHAARMQSPNHWP